MFRRVKFSLAIIASSLMLFTSAANAFDLFNSPSCDTQKPAPTICCAKLGSKASDSSLCQSAKKQNSNKTDPVIGIINTAANILALVAGIAAIIMILISGLTLAGSGGSSEVAASSRKRIIGALIGLVVVALAWTFTRFIVDRLVQ